MGSHSHSNKEIRKRKYQAQYEITLANKKRKEEKRKKWLEKKQLKKQNKEK